MRNKKGFTLVELLVVVAIIGILAVVAVPNLFKNIEKGKISDVEAEYNAYKSASLQYYSDTGKLPNHNMWEGGYKDLDDYLEWETIDVKGGTPIGGYYMLSSEDLDKRIGSIVDEDGKLEGDPHKLSDNGKLFLFIYYNDGAKEINITTGGLGKLVKDIGYGNVYCYKPNKEVFEIALKIK